MTIEENKALVRLNCMVLEQCKVELIDSYFAPNASVTNPGWTSAEKWRETVISTHRIARDLKVTVLDMIAEGDKVAAYVQIDITYVNPIAANLAAINGKPVTWRNMDFYRLAGGKIVGWEELGSMTYMLVKMGAYVLAPVAPA